MLSFCSVVTMFACSEQLSSHYDNAKDPKIQQSIAQGWLPKNLPISAFNIQESHNLDSNTCTGRFDFRKQDLAKLLTTLQPIEFTALQNQDDKKQNLADMGLKFYRNDDFDFAINHQASYAWFWCHPPKF